MQPVREHHERVLASPTLPGARNAGRCTAVCWDEASAGCPDRDDALQALPHCRSAENLTDPRGEQERKQVNKPEIEILGFSQLL